MNRLDTGSVETGLVILKYRENTNVRFLVDGVNLVLTGQTKEVSR